jgi:hypothetical protein
MNAILVSRIATWGLLLAAAATAAEPKFDEAAARAKARALTPVVLAANPAPLWPLMDPNMVAALKDSVSFAGTLRSIVAQTGALESVLRDEVTTPQPGLFVCTAHCKCANAKAPFTVMFAFDATGRIAGLFVRPDPDAPREEYKSPFADYQTKTPLRLPFNGEWTVFWGGRTLAENYHAFTHDQRFAMDVLIVKNGSTHADGGKTLADYYCFGQPVLAPAEGTVAWAQDSLPDNQPGHMDPAHATGNSLVIDHGNGEYSLLAHLQRGSLRFKVGDHVPADALVGRCGNSGNTTEPHLHYHLQNGPKPFEAEGLPVQFTKLVVDGKAVERAEIVKGQVVRRAP